MLNKERKQQLIKEFAIGAQDTGSADVSVGLLTEEIKLLTEHCKENPKDHSSRRGLITKVSRRKDLLRYLERKNNDRYKTLIVKLGLRK